MSTKRWFAFIFMGLLLSGEFHESLAERDEVKPGSERAFGYTIAIVLLIVSVFPLLHFSEPRIWPLPVAAAFGATGLMRPSLLRIPNRLWFRFGLLLHRVVNPVVLGILFYLVITPVALLVRTFGGKLLPLAFDESALTYWIVRDPYGPQPDSVRDQF
jgi:hypothetical protein